MYIPGPALYVYKARSRLNIIEADSEMFYLYILKSKKLPKTYVGISENIERRLEEHNKGYSKFTSIYRPWDVVYTEECQDRPSALKRERYFKSAVGRKKIKNILYSGVAQW